MTLGKSTEGSDTGLEVFWVADSALLLPVTPAQQHQPHTASLPEGNVPPVPSVTPSLKKVKANKNCLEAIHG